MNWLEKHLMKLQKKVHCVYISPIKALANDIQNLIGPLTEISENYLPDRAQEIKVGPELETHHNQSGKRC